MMALDPTIEEDNEQEIAFNDWFVARGATPSEYIYKHSSGRVAVAIESQRPGDGYRVEVYESTDYKHEDREFHLHEHVKTVGEDKDSHTTVASITEALTLATNAVLEIVENESWITHSLDTRKEQFIETDLSMSEAGEIFKRLVDRDQKIPHLFNERGGDPVALAEKYGEYEAAAFAAKASLGSIHPFWDTYVVDD